MLLTVYDLVEDYFGAIRFLQAAFDLRLFADRCLPPQDRGRNSGVV
jgi:hypothetical protein